jgi:urease accessory protein UreF
LHKLPQSAADARFVEPQEWLGACHPLVEQLGLAGALAAPGRGAGMLRSGPVCDAATLREFLRAYRDDVLLPLELPAICRAWQHAMRNQFRELADFDRRLVDEPRFQPLAGASQAVGQRHLRRFRPLHDVRFVQRYLAALDREEVHAWHTLVYGVTVWLFSLPLQQGLLGYGRQVTRGFIRAARSEAGLSEIEGLELFAELANPLAVSVPQVLAATVKPG